MKNVFKKCLLAALALALVGKVSAVGVGGWVGYNLASGVDSSACDLYKGTGGECSKGGLSLGGDLWLITLPGMPLKLGLGAAYIPVAYQKYSISGATSELSTRYIPVYAEGRFDIAGFFFGATLGYGISTSTASASATAGTTTVNTSVTAAGGTVTVGAFGGYSIGMGPASIDLGARLFSLSSTWNLMPFIGATISF
jgi:hypothetical protein